MFACPLRESHYQFLPHSITLFGAEIGSLAGDIDGFTKIHQVEFGDQTGHLNFHPHSGPFCVATVYVGYSSTSQGAALPHFLQIREIRNPFVKKDASTS